MWLTVSVRNSSGAWEVISREAASVSSQVVGDVGVSAYDIGGLVGQELLVELRDNEDCVIDQKEILAA